MIRSECVANMRYRSLAVPFYRNDIESHRKLCVLLMFANVNRGCPDQFLLFSVVHRVAGCDKLRRLTEPYLNKNQASVI